MNPATALHNRPSALRRHLPLLLILSVALVWRLLLWAQPLHLPANDEIEYLAVANDLLAGRGWVFYESWRWLRAPLYPLFLAGSLWLTDGDLHLAALPNLALSVGVVLLIYRLARELAPAARRRPALIAAGIAALLQTYATFASLYMSETLFSLMFGGALLALARWRNAGGVWWLPLGGALFGLACLTRSAALVMLPPAVLWLAWHAHGRSWSAGAIVRALLPGLLFATSAALLIAPWTLRNCRAYGECILIESGFAYNLWAFYEPREELDAINRALEAIPNPADRADEASRRGLERLREDPSILLRKLPAEWERLWVVKPIQDRFLLPDAYADPPPALFLGALILDDLLYVLTLGAAAVGLMQLFRAYREAAFQTQQPDPDASGAPGAALALLFLLWIGVFVGTTLLTHAEGRYRHFLFIVLIPLAGHGIDGLTGQLPRWSSFRTSMRSGVSLRAAPTLQWASARWVALAAAVALGLALLPLLVYYPWEWARGGAVRSVYRWWGDSRLTANEPVEAARAYTAALRASETPDGWIALGDLRRAQGDLVGAEEAYRLALTVEATYVGASARLGDLLRAQGRLDEARAAFRGRYLESSHMLDWSFRFLDVSPAAELDLGGGLDYGYVQGVYDAEEQQGASARWTGGVATLRLDGSAHPAELRLRAAAPRLDGAPVPLEICVARACQRVTLSAAWRELRVLLPAPGLITLRSSTFFAPDGRELGVLLDRASLLPSSAE